MWNVIIDDTPVLFYYGYFNFIRKCKTSKYARSLPQIQRSWLRWEREGGCNMWGISKYRVMQVWGLDRRWGIVAELSTGVFLCACVRFGIWCVREVWEWGGGRGEGRNVLWIVLQVPPWCHPPRSYAVVVGSHYLCRGDRVWCVGVGVDERG